MGGLPKISAADCDARAPAPGWRSGCGARRLRGVVGAGGSDRSRLGAFLPVDRLWPLRLAVLASVIACLRDAPEGSGGVTVNRRIAPPWRIWTTRLGVSC
jgi:hypothetical protein